MQQTLSGMNIVIPVSMLVVSLAVLIISVIAIYKIFTKAGFSGWLTLLAFIPVINICVYLYFAFAKWPIQKKLEEMQEELKMSIHSSLYPNYEVPPVPKGISPATAQDKNPQ